jgi:hypothetical protein
MLGIKIIGKRKRKAGVEPAVVGVPAFLRLANVNHGAPPSIAGDNICLNDYCQEAIC